MQEKNRHILKEAIRQLPEHDPSSSVWHDIRQSMSDRPLQQAVRDLPEHDPSEKVWQGIRTELQPSARVRKLRWRRWGYAAGFALLLSMAWWLGRMLPVGQDLRVTVSYRTEEIDSRLLQLDWEQDEADFAILDDLCQQHPFLCNRPNIQDWRRQLTELSRAKTDLVEVLGPYGTDLHLIEQLNEIEMERTRLLKQILTEVI